jgi:hypothetical protein
MKLAVARQQSVTKEPPRPFERSALDESLLIRHEHAFDLAGIVEQEDRKVCDPEAHHVAISVAGAQQKRERIPSNLPQIAEQKGPLRSGRDRAGFGSIRGHPDDVS